MKPLNPLPIDILLVEDQETDIMFTLQAFESSSLNCHVHVAKDGEEASQFLNKDNDYKDAPRPSLILLDINMPRKNGFELLEELKADKNLCDIPVIMFTSSTNSKDVLKSYQMGASAYVPKQSEFNDMVEFVKKIDDFWVNTAKLPQRH